MGQLESVRFGVFLGIATLIFGIFWAMFLVTQHNGIHNYLGRASLERMERMEEMMKQKETQRNSQEHGSNGFLVSSAYAAGDHDGGHENDDDNSANSGHKMAEQGTNHHADPVMGIAHERLRRGHLHAMGLGMVAIIISILFSFLTTVSDDRKLMFSGAIGLGGLIYPFSWIVMGFRTPSMGVEQAEISVMFIVGPAVLLVLSGLISFLYFFTCAMVGKKSV